MDSNFLEVIDGQKTELEKAAIILANDNFTIDQLAELTQIDKNLIVAYKEANADLEKAPYFVVYRLARLEKYVELIPYFNDEKIATAMGDIIEEFILENKILFKEDKEFSGMVDILAQEIVKDPELMVTMIQPFVSKQ